MKIGIVGGTGNISTSIVRLLVRQGHRVVCFNRGRQGKSPARVQTVICDRADRAAFEAAVKDQHLDAAIDMICFNREEALSSIRAFEGVAHVVHCSTVCTYGVAYDWMPVSEDHPLRPAIDYGRNKVVADSTFMEAYHRDGFPVTIIRPSTTYGPKLGLERQLAGELSWIDRIRKGKAIVICGDGSAIHQWLHVDDAALCFAHVLGKSHCIGQTYNMVKLGFFRWVDHHRTAMRVLGREVDLVGVPLADLVAMKVPGIGLCENVLSYNNYLSAERLYRDVPEFRPRISLAEGFARVVEALDREGRIPNSDDLEWEDRVIAAQRGIRQAAVVE